MAKKPYPTKRKKAYSNIKRKCKCSSCRADYMLTSRELYGSTRPRCPACGGPVNSSKYA